MIQQYKAFLVTTQVLWIRNAWLGYGCLCELMEKGDGPLDPCGNLWTLSVYYCWMAGLECSPEW